MKATRKLIPAIVMLLVSAIVLSTASYAWFSMNTTVAVTGMQVTTSVDSNIQIAASTAGTSKVDDSAFLNGLIQNVSGNLQPASTVNGTNFFYTYDATAAGAKLSGDYIAVTNNEIGASSAYADYVFELKAVNNSASQQYLTLDKLNLLYNTTAITAEKAYRVAVFVQAVDGVVYEAIGEEADAIYTMSGATNFTAGKAVSAADALADVTYGAPVAAMTVDANGTAYYKVTVRLFLEGEDTTCNSTTFVALSEAWELDLKFSLTEDNAAAVENIGSAV